ncbi:hypothetical protein DPMN_126911 [Dreissena polymorpha]|uniref:Uncharacterized protein n=1 Tax=Dreissena polymorpha TaxID=45954 RepID=A0A9D4JW13_DREPO|nr:hypothetical protein DPMN_126911 [Dreissena polymorpha]
MCLLDCSHKIAPLPGGHVFSLIRSIFKLVRDIHISNVLTKFHDDKAKHVTSRVFTSFFGEKDPPGGHVFLPIQTIIELNLRSPSLTQMNRLQDAIHIYSHIRKNAPPLGRHVFQAKVTILEFIQDISGTNHLSKIHEDWKINVASRVLTRKNTPPPGGHVFQPRDIIFKLVQDIIGMNLLTKFYVDRTINVASRVKNAPPLGSHVFQANVTIFELIQDIIETNLLTKSHEDWTINANVDVTQRITHDGRRNKR